MDRVLEVKNLNKSYSRFALKDVSFSLPEGCITGFIGINGGFLYSSVVSLFCV